MLTDEVAVIDEIQMIRDTVRGWAWTRALLGVCAHEVHLCGEASAIDLVRELTMGTGDEMEVSALQCVTCTVYPACLHSVCHPHSASCLSSCSV